MNGNFIDFEDSKNSHQKFVESLNPENYGNSELRERTSSRSQRNIRNYSTRAHTDYKGKKGTKKSFLVKAASIALAATIVGGGVAGCISNNNSDRNTDTNIEQSDSLNFNGVSEESIEKYTSLKNDIDNYYTKDTGLDQVDSEHEYIVEDLDNLSLDILHEKIASAYGIEPDQVSISVKAHGDYIINYTDKQGKASSIEITYFNNSPEQLCATLQDLERIQMNNPSQQSLKDMSDSLDSLMGTELVADENGNLIEYSLQDKNLSDNDKER